MEHENAGVERLTADERRLVHNFRIVNAVRQDCILCFSDELVKLETEDTRSIPENVVQLHRK